MSSYKYRTIATEINRRSLSRSRPRPLPDSNPFTRKASQARSLFREGLEQFSKSEFGAAKETFQRSLAIDRNLEEAYYYLGACLMEQNHFEEALANLQTFRNRNRKRKNGHLLVAKCLERLGREKEAVEVLSRFIFMFPGESSGYLARARLLISAGQHSEAIIDLEYLTSVKYRLDLTHLLKADCLFAEGLIQKAIQEWQLAIETGAPALHVNLRLIQAYSAIRRFDQA
jgi:tetratricopeptide (TPR) repeat protein